MQSRPVKSLSTSPAWRSMAVPSKATRAVDIIPKAGKPTILVTGAGGKTGNLIAQKIKASPDHDLLAIVRTAESKDKVMKKLNLSESEVAVADVTSAQLPSVFKGAQALIVATSATPQLLPLSLPGFIWNKFVMKKKVMPGFSFPQLPEQVDWLGQKAQFDAAKEAGLEHVVVVSSMGGTQPENTLNKIGDGNILVWKRKAEEYLIASGLTYTIIHPGGLKDSAGGESKLLLGVDDKFLERKVRNVSRADVAETCVQALSIPEAKNRSVDLISDADETEDITGTAADFKSLFVDMAEDCDYSINPPPV